MEKQKLVFNSKYYISKTYSGFYIWRLEGYHNGKTGTLKMYFKSFKNEEDLLYKFKNKKEYVISESIITLRKGTVNDLLDKCYKLSSDKVNSGYTGVVESDVTYSFLSNLKINKVDSNNNLKPMKAKPYDTKYVTFPMFAQRKYDGFRCIIRLEEVSKGEGLFEKKEVKPVLRTREGHRIVYELLEKQALALFEDGTRYYYDGELYIHGLPLNELRKRITIIQNGILHKGSVDSNDVKFICYDLAIPGVNQANRINILEDKFNNINKSKIKNIEFAETILVNSFEEIENFKEKFISEGYEGIILRSMYDEYYFGSRKKNILKYKREYTSEFVIVDIIVKNITYINNVKRTHIVFVMKNDINNSTFECVPFGDESYRQYVLNNKEQFIGKLATVKYRGRTGVYKLPFHANVELIYDKERNI